MGRWTVDKKAEGEDKRVVVLSKREEDKKKRRRPKTTGAQAAGKVPEERTQVERTEKHHPPPAWTIPKKKAPTPKVAKWKLGSPRGRGTLRRNRNNRSREKE